MHHTKAGDNNGRVWLLVGLLKRRGFCSGGAPLHHTWNRQRIAELDGMLARQAAAAGMSLRSTSALYRQSQRPRRAAINHTDTMRPLSAEEEGQGCGSGGRGAQLAPART